MKPVTEASSGILARHIPIVSAFAMQKKCIIMFRPVNRYATFLIGEGYGTKGLDIHGKSSDWGPMAGFIPRDQELSKCAGNAEKVRKGNRDNEHSLRKKGRVVAIQLVLTQNVLDKLIAENKIRGVGPGEYVGRKGRISRRFQIGSNLGVTYEKKGQFVPLQVMAYRTRNAVTPVTADYDLFALLTKGGSPTRNNFKIRGFMTSGQAAAIEELNSDLTTQAGTKQVINHGTECDNPFPEKDSEIALFLPNGQHEMLYTRGGDSHLKYLFAAAHILKYTVYCNDRWPGGTSGRPDLRAISQAIGVMLVQHKLNSDPSNVRKSDPVRVKKSTDALFYRWFYKTKLDPGLNIQLSYDERARLQLAHKKRPSPTVNIRFDPLADRRQQGVRYGNTR